MTDWPPDRIKTLRDERNQTQVEFGRDLYDTTPAQAQVLVSRLENEHMQPGAAVRRTLERMTEGEI